jgi:hypothetical protein
VSHGLLAGLDPRLDIGKMPPEWRADFDRGREAASVSPLVHGLTGEAQIGRYLIDVQEMTLSWKLKTSNSGHGGCSLVRRSTALYFCCGQMIPRTVVVAEHWGWILSTAIPRNPPTPLYALIEIRRASRRPRWLEVQMSIAAHSQNDPVDTSVPHGYQPTIAPRRHLDPEVAESIAEAKTRSGLSWRRLAALTGVSHPHLVLLAQGKRVPSTVTADQIISVLPMTLEQAEALRAVAVADRGKSRPR